MTVYSLFSGSSGNCIFIRENNTRVLLDAGGSFKRISEALENIGETPASIDAILLTHEHSDHTMGLEGFLKKREVPVFCLKKVAKEIYLALLAKKGAGNGASLLAKWIRTVEPGEEYEWGSVSFTPFSTPHDSMDSCGYVFNGKTLGVATDLGTVTPEVEEALCGCKNVILESNHDTEMLFSGPYPPYLKERVASDHGHLNNRDCASFACRLFCAGCRNLMLFHLSAENNDPELALETTRLALEQIEGFRDSGFSLSAALRRSETRLL